MVVEVERRAEIERLDEERLAHAVDLPDRDVEARDAALLTTRHPLASADLPHQIEHLRDPAREQLDKSVDDRDGQKEDLRPAQVPAIEQVRVEDPPVAGQEMIGPRPEDVTDERATILLEASEHLVTVALSHCGVTLWTRAEKIERREAAGHERAAELPSASAGTSLLRRLTHDPALGDEGLEAPCRLLRRERALIDGHARHVVLHDQLRRLDRQTLGDEAKPEVRSEIERPTSVEVELSETST